MENRASDPANDKIEEMSTKHKTKDQAKFHFIFPKAGF